jgi:hypothetical protein
MRRSLTAVLLVVASTAFAPVPTAGADDPGPTVILGPPPFIGPDAMIRGAGSTEYAGADTNSPARIEQSITQFERAVSYVRICANTTRGRMRVDGSTGGRNFHVKYRVGSRDVTRSVIAGTYRTSRLHRADCARQVKVVVRLKLWATSNGRTFRIRATDPAGARDSVATHVTVVGPLVVP